jgi:hypothetical protein
MSLPTLNGKECLVGWRGWELAMPHYLTTGGAPITVWMPGEATEAICRVFRYRPNEEHSADQRIPADNCQCGIYAFKTPYKLRQDNYLNQSLLGEVWLWGKVIECTMGFRAEYAYPKALYLPSLDTMISRGRPHETITREMWEFKRMEAELVAFRYNVPFATIDATHPIYTKTKDELEEEATWLAQDAAMRAQEMLRAKLYNAKLKAAALQQPSKYPQLYKNLWEEIEAEAQGDGEVG